MAVGQDCPKEGAVLSPPSAAWRQRLDLRRNLELREENGEAYESRIHIEECVPS